LYYHRKGTGSGANKWFIHQQGGGLCFLSCALNSVCFLMCDSSPQAGATISTPA
jgi:hypothetical protein